MRPHLPAHSRVFNGLCSPPRPGLGRSGKAVVKVLLSTVALGFPGNWENRSLLTLDSTSRESLQRRSWQFPCISCEYQELKESPVKEIPASGRKAIAVGPAVITFLAALNTVPPIQNYLGMGGKCNFYPNLLLWLGWGMLSGPRDAVQACLASPLARLPLKSQVILVCQRHEE